ncbi:[protein ADP-ribosylglutamate] hydrolase [Pyrococcus sp. ST04]|nr:[protein ADP-ribosylglutamate] hydrolase [Pyrococcus sp. ST04]AFK22979.1 hypothetical protein Py04_1406 [Pyrococcus sp. ST04]
MIRIVKGDITKFRADAIVNAANKYLEHGGGVAYAIAKAAAGDVYEYIKISKEEMKKQLGKDWIEHGEVVVTPPLRLAENGVKYVIHTVGPYCGGKWDNEKEEKLKLAILGALKKADELGVRSIAFPAISAGIYGCPLENVVRVFASVAEEFLKNARNVKEIYLVLYSDRDYKVAISSLGVVGNES